MRADKLINIDLLISHFPERLRNYLSIAIYLIILVFLFLRIHNGIRLSLFSQKRVFQGIPGFSYSWAMLGIPVRCLLQSATVVLKIQQLLRRK